MAIYVTSDLHGLQKNDFIALLKKAHFTNDDWLYILGDVIDRENDGGIELLSWIMMRDNMELILGEHESMLLSCAFVFDSGAQSAAKFTPEQMMHLKKYMANGGDVTLKALKELNETSPESVNDILDYLSEALPYEMVNAGGKDFLLVHAGLDNFDKSKKLGDYTAEELTTISPDISQKYFDDIITVFGHTPTDFYGSEYDGKILKTETWIDIDVGVPDNFPVLLRLDDMKEFYL